ncbi:hypothetical protein [Massilibacterium senegalense]|uniref:hypothetical protein n=1 Tax=Massilibacterium senegalense TaxID=1632858 RepID=UPI00078485CE|nr:hypothetical protein [Massilibacterium senegalense]
MVYAPPMIQDQYVQYVKRTERKGPTALETTKVRKITLNPEEERWKRQGIIPLHPAKNLRRRQVIFKRKERNEQVEHMIQEVTQKGLVINEVV